MMIVHQIVGIHHDVARADTKDVDLYVANTLVHDVAVRHRGATTDCRVAHRMDVERRNAGDIVGREKALGDLVRAIHEGSEKLVVVATSHYPGSTPGLVMLWRC